MQPYPAQDDTRLARVVSDIQDLMHDTGPATQTKIERWVTLILRDAESRRAWWFLKNVASASLGSGDDIVDITGDIDKVVRVYCPYRLTQISLEQLVELRARAIADATPNAATKATHYALEAGRRVHLWPCPSAAVVFNLLYMRPFATEILPDVWEMILVDGVVGRYGRHFDRDALMDDPADFETRYERALKRAAVESWDVRGFTNWDPELPADSTVTADSATDTATDFVNPASLTGIGHECVYPLVVGP